MTAQETGMPAPLPFTGERMVPHASDIATELFHWQRYLFFRQWYEGRRVIDAASGEGYGTGYIANFAASALGLDVAAEAVAHSSEKYANADFRVADVCDFDYSDADLVVSFETIEHLDDPTCFLRALASCQGNIILSTPNRDTHSPGNDLSDKPLNPFHTVEWRPSEFAQLISSSFPDRQVRFLSQQGVWPGTIREGLDEQAMYTIAVIGNGDLPRWPALGIAVPTYNGSSRCRDLVVGATRFYPGDIEFAIVNNGSNPEETERLRGLQADFPAHVHLVHLAKNVGYGIGANTGLNFLAELGRCDYYCVSNDDVAPAVDCLPQLVSAMRELEKAGQKPGVVGPVTNSISGRQLVDVGPYRTYAEMIDRAEAWNRQHHSSGTQVLQLRGLFMVVHPDCLAEVGGFDPIFGIGNFEDDDHNLRCRLAGYSLWIADGAFLHHAGSSTFNEMDVDYDANIQRNLQLFCEKWGFDSFEEFLTVGERPSGLALHIPMGASIEPSGYVVTIGGEVIDLVRQASDVEFAAYVFSRMRGRPREARLALIELLENAA